jgi:hypothetical protein
MEINQNNRNTKEPNTGIKVIMLIALIGLLILGILLPIKLVPNAVTGVRSFFSSLFGGGDVRLAVDKNELRSGEAFVLSWSGGTRDNGSYQLSYACTEGVRIETSVNQPFERITCDSQFYFNPINNSIELTVVSDMDRVVDIPVTLSFLENNADTSEVLGDIILTVTNPNIEEAPIGTGTTTPTTTPRPIATPTPSATPKPTTTPKPSTIVTPRKVDRPSNPNGQTDLAVQILAVGYLNPQTNTFVQFPSATGKMRPAVKFVVINNGDKTSPRWSFTAKLPSKTNPTYTAINREALGPGDGIEYVLGFENINDVRENIVTITVDPQNLIPELRENNNIYSAKIINPQSVPAVTPTPSPIYTGSADLVARVISSEYTNNRATVRFEVQNIGGTASGSFRFKAALPSSTNPEYVSAYQNGLAKGAKTYFTLTFDNLHNYGNNYAHITVDPWNEVRESNENNNSITATIYR